MQLRALALLPILVGIGLAPDSEAAITSTFTIGSVPVPHSNPFTEIHPWQANAASDILAYHKAYLTWTKCVAGVEPRISGTASLHLEKPDGSTYPVETVAYVVTSGNCYQAGFEKILGAPGLYIAEVIDAPDHGASHGATQTFTANPGTAANLASNVLPPAHVGTALDLVLTRSSHGAAGAQAGTITPTITGPGSPASLSGQAYSFAANPTGLAQQQLTWTWTPIAAGTYTIVADDVATSGSAVDVTWTIKVYATAATVTLSSIRDEFCARNPNESGVYWHKTSRGGAGDQDGTVTVTASHDTEGAQDPVTFDYDMELPPEYAGNEFSAFWEVGIVVQTDFNVPGEWTVSFDDVATVGTSRDATIVIDVPEPAYDWTGVHSPVETYPTHPSCRPWGGWIPTATPEELVGQNQLTWHNTGTRDLVVVVQFLDDAFAASGEADIPIDGELVWRHVIQDSLAFLDEDDVTETPSPDGTGTFVVPPGERLWLWYKLPAAAPDAAPHPEDYSAPYTVTTYEANP